MSKLTAENIWWPDCTQNHTQVVEGSNEHHRPQDRGVVSFDHLYTMKQNTLSIIWACACGRTLSRLKYPPEKR